MKARAIKLYDERFGDDWERRVEDHWDYDDFKRDPRNENWRRGWISFDCAHYDPGGDRVYLGITSFDADIFRAYDRKTGKFLDLGYSKVADPYDAKFHRSLERGPDGKLYAAIALLHDVDRFHEAPGSAIVRYDPKAGELAKIATPMPHVYIQGIAIDQGRGLIYGMCFPPEKLVSYDIATGEVIDYGLIGTGIGGMCQGENICLDDDGCCWSAWQLTRAWQNHPGPDIQRLCKVDPRERRIIFYQKGLPRPDGQHGTTKMEGLFNLGDGRMYASGANGSLFRFDPKTADAEYLFTPIKDRPSRLTSLVIGKDGNAYGVTGRGGKCELLRFDFRNTKYELLGPIADAESGEPLFQCHHLVLADDGTIYACENDVPHRSGYLWEISGVF